MCGGFAASIRKTAQLTRHGRVSWLGKLAVCTHPINQSMALFAASGANVSRQGINPPGAGGDLLVYPATTLAALAARPPSPVALALSLPGARVVSPGRRIPSAQTPLKLGAIVLVLILG